MNYLRIIALYAALTVIWSWFLITGGPLFYLEGGWAELGRPEIAAAAAYCVREAAISTLMGTALGSLMFWAITADYPASVARALGIFALPLCAIVGFIISLTLLSRVLDADSSDVFLDLRIALWTGISALIGALIGPWRHHRRLTM